MVKMEQIWVLVCGVLANPLGAAASDQDGATNQIQSACYVETNSDPSGSDSDNTETKTEAKVMIGENQSAKADEELYIQSHLKHMPREIPIQSHGAPGPPSTATFKDTGMLYSTPTLEQDQLLSNIEYEKPSHLPKQPWMRSATPIDDRLLTDLKTEMKMEYSDKNQNKEEIHIGFKEETKQTPAWPKEDLQDFIRQAVRDAFASGKPDNVTFFDAAIVYDKIDYDRADDMRLEMKRIIQDELQEELHIELFDSENFSQSMVLVVEDVVNRAFVILVYLSRNTDYSPNLHLFVEEAVGLTRLAIVPPGSFSDRQYLLKPVHTEPPERRNYKTPVGLVTMNGIDWYDKYSKFTRHKIVEMMKSAIEKRKRRSRKYGSAGQIAAHPKQAAIDDIRTGQSAFTQRLHQTQSADSCYLQVTNTSNLVNCQHAPYSSNAHDSTDWSINPGQGSDFPSYRSSTQITYKGSEHHNNPDVRISTTPAAYPGQPRSSTDSTSTTQRGYVQQPGPFYANSIQQVHDQQQIYGRQANAIHNQPEMQDYLVPMENLQYNEPQQDHYLAPDQRNHAHSDLLTPLRREDYVDIVNPKPYQYPRETYPPIQQFRPDIQHTTGYVSDPRYGQQIPLQARNTLQPLNQPPIATQFQAKETWLRTSHQLPVETQLKARKTSQRSSHEPPAEEQFQAGDSWQSANRLPPANSVPLSHDARYSTDRNFDTELFSDLSTNDVEIDTRPSILHKTNVESSRKSKRSRKKKNRRKDGSDSHDDPPLGSFRDLLKSSGGRAVNIIGGKITQIGNNNKVNMHKEYVIGNEGESEKNEVFKNVLDADENNECFQEENRQTTNDFAKGSIETVSDIFENMDAVDPGKSSTRNKGVGNYCRDKKISYQSNISDSLAITGQKQEEVNTSSESNGLHKAFSSLPPTSTENEAVSSDSELFGSGSEYSLSSGSISSRSSARTSFETVSSSTPSDSFVSSTSKKSGLSSIVQRAYNMNIKGHSSTEVTVDSDVD
ncbi:uncharacterized protein LOC128217564 isoform X2 [Mya arenaria]|nr:uncharacterized protein LOC128217564 isoform X2 [Mya arenaria]